MLGIEPNELNERQLHEQVADTESHKSQETGIVGFFYRMYRDEVRARLGGLSGLRILEIGCGEGLMFEGTAIFPVQMDVSIKRVRRAVGKCRYLLCADGYQLPFRDASFDAVLLIAVLEHTREPWRILAEARRVLTPGGRAIIVVPNDVVMSAGRLVLGKFPIRYPDHLTFTTPTLMNRWLHQGFVISENFVLPFRWLPFVFNLYYFVVAEKKLTENPAGTSVNSGSF